MAEWQWAKIRRTIHILKKQRIVLLRRLEEINENLRRVPNPSRARRELLEARESIKVALRLNAKALRLLKSIWVA
ncbi:hypothetical protein D3C76_1457280 [compost metagenome]